MKRNLLHGNTDTYGMLALDEGTHSYVIVASVANDKGGYCNVGVPFERASEIAIAAYKMLAIAMPEMNAAELDYLKRKLRQLDA